MLSSNLKPLCRRNRLRLVPRVKAFSRRLKALRFLPVCWEFNRIHLWIRLDSLIPMKAKRFGAKRWSHADLWHRKTSCLRITVEPDGEGHSHLVRDCLQGGLRCLVSGLENNVCQFLVRWFQC